MYVPRDYNEQDDVYDKQLPAAAFVAGHALGRQDQQQRQFAGNPSRHEVVREWLKTIALLAGFANVLVLAWVFWVHGVAVYHREVHTETIARDGAQSVIDNHCNKPDVINAAHSIRFCNEQRAILESDFTMNVLDGMKREFLEHIPIVGHCLSHDSCQLIILFVMEFARQNMVYFSLVPISIIALAYLVWTGRVCKKAVDTTREYRRDPEFLPHRHSIEMTTNDRAKQRDNIAPLSGIFFNQNQDEFKKRS